MHMPAPLLKRYRLRGVGGHSESLHGLDVTLDAVLPAIYRRM